MKLPSLFGPTITPLQGANKRSWTAAFSSPAYLVIGAALIGVARYADARDLAAVMAGLTALWALIALALTLKRYYALSDIAATPIGSATQGYVKLSGRCAPIAGDPPLGFGMMPSCVWYRFTRATLGEDNVKTEYGESDANFILVDDSGQCVIDPDKAEIYTEHFDSWTEDGFSYRAEYLRVGDRLKVLGELITQRKNDTRSDRKMDVLALLRRWKKSPEILLQRFDANGNGIIDPEEWKAARYTANSAIEAEHTGPAAYAGLTFIRKPGHGKPYIIVNGNVKKFVDRYRLLTRVHLAGFLVALITWAVFAG